VILNVIDRRGRPYRWKTINAIVESTWHDNTVADADQASDEGTDDEIGYAERRGHSVAEAVSWAHAMEEAVTLYLYDEGNGA
jgi:hypothetical protein